MPRLLCRLAKTDNDGAAAGFACDLDDTDEWTVSAKGMDCRVVPAALLAMTEENKSGGCAATTPPFGPPSIEGMTKAHWTNSTRRVRPNQKVLTH